MTVAGRRHIVCRNEAEAEKDAQDRAAVLEGLERQLARGDKALVGNAAYRRFLKTVGPHFAIDHAKAEATVTRGSHSYTLRTEATGTTASLFKAVRLALPPRLTTEDPARDKRRPPRPKTRRGRPRRRATAP